MKPNTHDENLSRKIKMITGVGGEKEFNKIFREMLLATNALELASMEEKDKYPRRKLK